MDDLLQALKLQRFGLLLDGVTVIFPDRTSLSQRTVNTAGSCEVAEKILPVHERLLFRMRDWVARC